MNTMMNIKFSILTVVILLMSGCATNYSCSGVPDTPCRSISGVYNNTSSGIPDYRDEQEAGNTNSDSSNQSSNINISTSNNVLNYITAGDPILTEPRILRGLIFPYEDASKDLIIGGYVFMRISESQWLMVD